MAVKSGLKGLYFIGNAWHSWLAEKHGFDASTLDALPIMLYNMNRHSNSYVDRICRRFTDMSLRELYREAFSKPTVYRYKDVIKCVPPARATVEQYPCVIPNWDNTPRRGSRGVVFHESTPEMFRRHLRQAIEEVGFNEPERRLVFIKSWNEWAEGNYLEPDQRYGRSYLEIIRTEVFKTRRPAS